MHNTLKRDDSLSLGWLSNHEAFEPAHVDPYAEFEDRKGENNKGKTAIGFYKRDRGDLLDEKKTLSRDMNQTSNSKWRINGNKKLKVEKNAKFGGGKIIPNLAIIGADAFNIREEESAEEQDDSFEKSPIPEVLQINKDIEENIGKKLFPDGRVVTPFMGGRQAILDKEDSYPDIDSFDLESLKS